MLGTMSKELKDPVLLALKIILDGVLIPSNIFTCVKWQIPSADGGSDFESLQVIIPMPVRQG
jgi:hypothetical protein